MTLMSSRQIMRNTPAAWRVIGPLLVVACTATEVKPPIQLGFVSTFEADSGTFGGDERIARLAVEEINRRGGINGHPLELRMKDDEADPEVARQRMQEFIDEGAVGMIGPAYSSYVELAYPLARDNEFPMISPSSTAPSLSTVDDGGYMFRAVANDSVQSLAIAYYMTSVATPAITQVTVVHEDSSYGAGLADAFQDAFANVGGTVDGRVSYGEGEPASSAEAAAKVMDDLEQLPHRPALIVLIGIDADGSAIMKAWSERASWSDVPWFFTDGMYEPGFLADLPAGCAGMLGTAPTVPTLGDAYGVLRDDYAAKYPDRELDQESSFGPNIWDSVFLFASALVAQDAAHEPFGGAGLRDRMTQVSREPGLILHAGQWRDMIGTLERGNDIDYDGASGPFDFDSAGEPIGPYQVWTIVPSADALVFDQALFIDARQIAKLRGAGRLER